MQNQIDPSSWHWQLIDWHPRIRCIPSYLKTKPELIGLPLACKWYHIFCHLYQNNTIAESQIDKGGNVNPNMT
jgi:hypothetical protein